MSNDLAYPGVARKNSNIPRPPALNTEEASREPQFHTEQITPKSDLSGAKNAKGNKSQFQSFQNTYFPRPKGNTQRCGPYTPESHRPTSQTVSESDSIVNIKTKTGGHNWDNNQYYLTHGSKQRSRQHSSRKNNALVPVHNSKRNHEAGAVYRTEFSANKQKLERTSGRSQ